MKVSHSFPELVHQWVLTIRWCLGMIEVRSHGYRWRENRKLNVDIFYLTVHVMHGAWKVPAAVQWVFIYMQLTCVEHVCVRYEVDAVRRRWAAGVYWMWVNLSTKKDWKMPSDRILFILHCECLVSVDYMLGKFSMNVLNHIENMRARKSAHSWYFMGWTQVLRDGERRYQLNLC